MRKYFAVILNVPKNFAIKLSSYMIKKMRQIASSQIEYLSNEPSFFTLNPTLSILHFAYFNFQPYRSGRSLNSKKPFLLENVP
jgi:hypothetical protein